MKQTENVGTKEFIIEGLLSYPIAVELCERFKTEISQFFANTFNKHRSQLPINITAEKAEWQRYYFGYYVESKGSQYRYLGLYYDLGATSPRIILVTTKDEKLLKVNANWKPKNQAFQYDPGQKYFNAHLISYEIPKENSEFEKNVEELLLEGIGFMKEFSR